MPSSRMDRFMRLTFIAGVVLLACGMAFWGWLLYQHNHAPANAATSTTPVGMPVLTIPEFKLVDLDGKPATRELLLGKVTVLQFMFTNCPLACPAMTMEMERLQKRLKGTGVQFVSMSFDPIHDTPEAMRSFARERFGVDESNWKFLTEVPPGSTARSIYEKDLQQYIEDKADDVIKAKGGADMANINHSLNLFLIGPDGTVAGIYNSKHSDEMENLVRHALLLSKQVKAP